MAATVKVYEYWGSGPSTTAVPASGAKFCTLSTNEPGSSYPMVRPTTTGTNYSYEKYFALYAETSASSYINNVKFFTDGSYASGASWAGVTLSAGTAASYTEPTGTSGVTGTLSSIATSAAFDYNSGNKLSIAGTSSGGATGKFTDYLVLQLSVTSAAGPGSLASETMSFEYDEV